MIGVVRIAVASALAATASVVATAGIAGAVPNDPAAVVYVSELHYDNAGDDAGEAIEITGPAGTDLTGWSVVLYNGAGGASYNTRMLSGTLADQGGGLGTTVLTYPLNGIQNGSPDGIALVNAASEVIQFLSYEGSFTAVGGVADGVASLDIGVAENSSPNGLSLQRKPDGSGWWGPKCASFGELNDPAAPDACPPPPPVVRKIHEVQGSGTASPLVGQGAVIEGIVTDDREGPVPTGGMRGFFVQEEAADVDGDAATSEGIFVFNGNNDNVAVGDQVRVTGTVVEFAQGASTLTELSNVTAIEVLSSGNASPAPVTIEFPVTELSDLEAYEGMIATLPQTLVVAEYFNYDRFGEIVVALPAPGEARPMSPTAVFDPASPEAADRAAFNLRSRITIDDGISTQNPETLIHPITRDLFTLENRFRGGDTVSGLTGPITEGFGLYRILPLGEGAGYAEWVRNPAPTEPEPVGGSLRVASMNTLNYFLTIDAGTSAWICGPQQTMECRGADDAGELARQRVRLLNALEGLNADVIGLNELENTPGVEPLADIAAGLNERFGDGTYAYIAAGDNSVVGTDAIKVGLIYRPGAVTPIGTTAVLDTPQFLDPNNTGTDRNRAAVAQTFRVNATGEVFSVTINHFKSKGSACEEAGETTLAGNCNVTRTLTAQVLADWIATSPTGVPDSDWLIMGDLNSYDHEAPIGVLEAAGYTDLAKAFHGEYAYSYVFDGQSGYLDYALASGSIASQVTGMTDWHINADEADVIDYDTTFNSNYQDSLFDPASPARASDHDAVLVGLDLRSGIRVSASPDTILLPLRQMVPIRLTAKGAPGTSYTAVALSATSSEPDSGLGRFDFPNDIQITNGNIKVRAEVFGCPARTYTIQVQASGGGQVLYTAADVRVLNLLGILFGCR